MTPYEARVLVMSRLAAAKNTAPEAQSADQRALVEICGLVLEHREACEARARRFTFGRAMDVTVTLNQLHAALGLPAVGSK